MKVCYVTHLPNLTGANQSLLDILSKWEHQKVEAMVLLGKHGPLEEELKQLGIPYKVIPYSSEIKDQKSSIKNLIKQIKCLFAKERIKRFFIEEKFDLIHNNTLLSGIGMEAAQQAGIPCICHMRELIVPEHNVELINPKKQFGRLRKAEKAIAISECVKNRFISEVAENKIIVLSDGINISKYEMPTKKVFGELHNDGTGVVNFMLAGRISPGKGQLEAIKAIEIVKKYVEKEKIIGVKEINLYIVGSIGDKCYNEKIKEYVKNKNIQGIHFIEFCSDLSQLRGKCDIGLTCSKSEALGRVTIENMLSKLLVIGANGDGTSEILSEERGLLYEVGDEKDLAEKIIFALKNREKLGYMIENAYNYAKEKFDGETYNTKLYKIYREVIDENYKERRKDI